MTHYSAAFKRNNSDENQRRKHGQNVTNATSLRGFNSPKMFIYYSKYRSFTVIWD